MKQITGIIGAMDSEVAALKAAMTIESQTTIADMEFCVGQIEGNPVVVVRCGMGKVNAGVCAQLLISIFGATRIVNTGVAGSLDNRIDIGDIVVSVDAVQHDFDVSPVGFARGEIPYTGLYAFPADAELRKKAMKAAQENAKGQQVFEGRVCSGDQFIASMAQKDAITSAFGGMCCEMEGASIAQVCYLNHVPFVIIRAISDKADASAEVPFEQFQVNAARNCSLIVLAMVREA